VEDRSPKNGGESSEVTEPEKDDRRQRSLFDF
jgi:hypothetical protein